MAKQHGQTVAPPPAEVQAAIDRFKQSGWARSIAVKFQDKEQLRQVGVEVLAALLPGWLRRMGEQLGADEVAVEAKRGW
jgi:hypothetical protein